MSIVAECLRWYAYRHVNGKLFLRRYYDMGDVVEARTSPFVASCTEPFEADDYESALIIAEELLP